jgi:hypothetical protein
LDKQYHDLSENFSGKLTFDEKIIAYQAKLDEKSKIELDKKLAEFKEIELTKLRIEEREKLRAEIQNYRLDLEHKYQKKYDALKQKETAMADIQTQKKDLEEREVYLQRQQLLEEMKQLRDKEAELKKNFDSQLKLNKNDASKYQHLDEELKKREALLKLAESEYAKKLKDEKERIRIELERAYAQRDFALQSVETKNKQDSVYNEIERAHLDRMKLEFSGQQMRLNEIDLELQKAVGEATCLRQENELLKEKLSHCMDYEFVVQENKMLKYKLDVSKELIGEKSLTKRSTSGLLANPENADMFSSRGAQDAYVPKRKRSVTFEQLTENTNEDGRGMDVPPLEFKENVNDEMLGSSRKLTLRDEGDKILNDAIERIEESHNAENQSFLNGELKNLYEMQIFEQRKLQETVNDVKQQIEFLFSGVPAASQADSKPLKGTASLIVDSYGKSASGKVDLGSDEFILSAKERLKYLESEEERIQQIYRDYQHKMKSKYYPMNDDEENEIKLVTQKKKDYDLSSFERFLELTTRATVNSKVMKDEIENEIESYNKSKEAKEKSEIAMESLKSVEERIMNASVNNFAGRRLNQEKATKRDQSSSRSESPNRRNIADFGFKKPQDLNLFARKYTDDETTVTEKETSKKPASPVKNLTFYEDDRTIDSESKPISKAKFDFVSDKDTSPKHNFASPFYKSFDEEKKETTPPKRRITIEYSSSSSPSTDASDDNLRIGKSDKNEKKNVEFNKNQEDDDDDDFKW